MLDAVVRGDNPADRGTKMSGVLAENDDLLSLSISSRGGEGTGNLHHLPAREGLGQHARQSAHSFGTEFGAG